MFILFLLISNSFAENKCGYYCTWAVENNILTISGTGDMFDYLTFNLANPPWYDYRSDVTEIIIEDGIIRIGDYTFSSFSKLTNVIIPNTVNAIGEGAFNNCPLLTNIKIPDSVTYIGKHGFRDCKALTSVTIPHWVLTLNNYTFKGCSSLESVTIGNRVESIGDSSFESCSSLTSVTIGKSVIKIYDSAFKSCSNLKSILYRGETLNSCGENVFFEANENANIYVPLTYEGDKFCEKNVEKKPICLEFTNEFGEIVESEKDCTCVERAEKNENNKFKCSCNDLTREQYNNTCLCTKSKFIPTKDGCKCEDGYKMENKKCIPDGTFLTFILLAVIILFLYF